MNCILFDTIPRAFFSCDQLYHHRRHFSPAARASWTANPAPDGENLMRRVFNRARYCSLVPDETIRAAEKTLLITLGGRIYPYKN